MFKLGFSSQGSKQNEKETLENYVAILKKEKLLVATDNVEQKQKLIALQGFTDLEIAHYKADNILLEILLDLGLDNIVEEYEKIDKWYA